MELAMMVVVYRYAKRAQAAVDLGRIAEFMRCSGRRALAIAMRRSCSARALLARYTTRPQWAVVYALVLGLFV